MNNCQDEELLIGRVGAITGVYQHHQHCVVDAAGGRRLLRGVARLVGAEP